MSIGSSGRIVIELDPEIKRVLYSALMREGLTLKDWFLREAKIYLAEAEKMQLVSTVVDIKLTSDITPVADERRAQNIFNRKIDLKSTAVSSNTKAHDE
jgi:hypothetical protein